MKKVIGWMSTFMIFLNLLAPVSHAAESVDSHEYAQGLFYLDMYYKGEGNEYVESIEVHNEYLLDDQGVYQYSSGNGGTVVSHVIQLAEDGIYELAYFPESYEGKDFRYSEDAVDDQKSLVLPRYLSIGNKFSRGYRGEKQYVVEDIMEEFAVGDEVYKKVLVVAQQTEKGTHREYYAPGVGLVHEEDLSDSYKMHSSLDSVVQPIYRLEDGELLPVAP